MKIMGNSIRLLIAFVMISTCWTSCGTKNDDPLNLAKDLERCIRSRFFSEKEHDFGPYQMGMSRAAFEDASIGVNLLRAEAEIVDSISLCGNDRVYCEAAYRFFDSRLEDIQVSFFFSDPGDQKIPQVDKLLEQELSERYGVFESEQGTRVWNVARQHRILQVFLFEGVAADGRPTLKVLYTYEGKVAV